jgi:two-component system sensor histidine kinase/response regulator
MQTELHTILIVDDNRNNLTTLRLLLRRLPDCLVVEASSGEEALLLLIEHDVDLVLLDVQMPVMDGFETARHMRMTERTRHIPILFITAVFRAEEFMRQGFEVGAVDYLTKPLDDNLLLNRVQLYLRLFDREKQLRSALGSLGEKERELAEINRELERRVASRTSELERKNRELEQEIGRRRETEQRLRKAKREADEANRAKSEFLATMSHEIRTPMNTILGVGELLARNHGSEEQTHYLELFTSAGESLLEIINDILDISKIEAGGVELEHKIFSLRRIAYDAIDIIEPRASAKGLQIVFCGFRSLPDYVIGDPSRIRQVLINLLGNAVKFTENGMVALLGDGERLQENRWQVVFHVVDTGIGIPQEQQQRVFARFTQADTSTTRKYGGTGLGLTISQRLIELMSGTLTLHSEEDCSSTFTVTLPLEEAQPADLPCEEQLLAGLHVLLVNDQVAHPSFFEDTMSVWGAQIERLNLTGEGGDYLLDGLHCATVDLVFVYLERFSEERLLELLNRARERSEFNESAWVVCAPFSTRTLPRQMREIGVVLMPERADEEILRRGIHAALERRILNHQTDANELSPLTILLAEDGEDNIELFRAFLSSQPHRIDVAMNGEEAVKRFIQQEGHYDLVFMDIQMPVMDGHAATRTIRSWETEQGRKPVPILALSANAFTSDVEKSLAAGCTSHLTKPIKKALLLKEIADYGYGTLLRGIGEQRPDRQGVA